MTFIHPWFLLGAILSVVPVLIHLWYQRRLKRIPFSTLQFLKKTEARRFGWLRLREWLVLLMRCLFILFLFLGLARPQFRSRVLGTGKLSSVCLILDNSYSMDYGDNFDEMKVVAQQVVKRYSPKSEFCIIPLCGKQKDRSYWMSRTSALAGLATVRLCYDAGSIAAALMLVPAGEPKYNVDYVYIGDGQSSNFHDFPAVLAGKTKFYWIKIPTGSNVGISGVILKDPVAIPTREYELRATVRNYSPLTWSGRIGLTSGDHYLEKECAVPAGSSQEVDLNLPVELLTGKVEIFDDSLPIDNVYYFSKTLPRGLKVLLVGEGPYIARALTSGNESSATFSVDNVLKMSNVDLRIYDVVILHGVGEISEVDRIKLVNHLGKPRAGLIVVLGSEMGDNLRDFLSSWCHIENEIVPKGYVTVEPPANEHPIFEVFGPGNVLGDVEYSQYFKVDTDQGVLAYFTGGDPFIIIRENICIVTGLLDPRATNFVFKNAFVPVLLRILASLTSERSREYYIGDEVPNYDMIKEPNGEFLSRGDVFLVPGFHETDKETLCVNVKPSEGDLSVLGEERAEILSVQQIDPERRLAGSDLTDLVLVLALLALALELGLLLLR
jgi:hypothetical protein